jgi:hypothetical protein
VSALTGLLNTAWMWKCGLEAAAFARATRRLADTQARLLQATLQANRDTAFGAAHDFASIRDARDYQSRVPPVTYQDLAPWVERIAAGEPNVLTWEPVRLLEPTSGTTAGEKWIAYTAGLRRQFQRGVAAWIADLYSGRPAVRRGRAYWSISPALGPPRRSPGGLPIGFDDDSAYLGGLERLALKHLLVVPPAVTRLTDLTAFRYCTVLFLLAAADLALISVWNPTFLTALLAPLPEWQDRLCFDLERGTLSAPGAGGAEALRAVRAALRPDPRRARRLSAIFRSGAPLADCLGHVWPRLALLSCWTDAAAGQFVPQLRALFPGVEIQPKGLLATEGFVSFPVLGQPGGALAARCHFFEFEEDGGGCRLAHELERGARYGVMLTTAGGLYRYRLRDEVEVVGFLRQCPLLRFLGKSDCVSDLAGEKLAEAHVRAVLDRVFAARGLAPSFALLVPVSGCPPRYRLYLQGAALSLNLLAGLRADLEEGLAENPYYRQAVGLGQLAPVELCLLVDEGQPGWLLYEQECVARGMKCGDIKPTALARGPGWAEAFERQVAGP